jgi:CopG family nickel-responsive transcriptional regulator
MRVNNMNLLSWFLHYNISVTGLGIISISIPDSLLRRVDEIAESLGFTGRSEFFREAVRRMLDQLESMKGEMHRIFVITILSDHSVYPGSDRRILEVIHEYQPVVRAFYHQLLGDGLCINVAILETQWPLLSKILRDLRGIKGVVDVQVSGLALRA